MPMYGLFDLKDKTRKYFKFSKEEVKGLIISILVLAFIVSFREWGDKQFELITGLWNLFNSIIIMALIILVHHSVQRITALHQGFRAEHKLWIYGIVAGLIVCIVSRGVIWQLLFAAGVFLHHMSVHRLGFFRYGLNTKVNGTVALSGPLANVLLAIIFMIFSGFFPENILIQKVVKFSLWFAIMNMLPIPPLDGSRVFFASRLTYALLFGIIIGAAIFIYLQTNVLLAIIGSLVIGVITWFVYYVSFERKVW